MEASTSSRYRITIRPRTSDCSAPAAMNSRPDIGMISAHGRAMVTHVVTISPVTGSCVICCSCSCTLWRSLPLATAAMSDNQRHNQDKRAEQNRRNREGSKQKESRLTPRHVFQVIEHYGFLGGFAGGGGFGHGGGGGFDPYLFTFARDAPSLNSCRPAPV